jgi:hypothetical protein
MFDLDLGEYGDLFALSAGAVLSTGSLKIEYLGI